MPMLASSIRAVSSTSSILAVAQALKPFGPHAEISGILHDAVEDSAWTFQRLLGAGVPERSVRAIKGVTRPVGSKVSYLDWIRGMTLREQYEPIDFIKPAILDQAGLSPCFTCRWFPCSSLLTTCTTACRHERSLVPRGRGFCGGTLGRGMNSKRACQMRSWPSCAVASQRKSSARKSVAGSIGNERACKGVVWTYTVKSCKIVAWMQLKSVIRVGTGMCNRWHRMLRKRRWRRSLVLMALQSHAGRVVSRQSQKAWPRSHAPMAGQYWRLS